MEPIFSLVIAVVIIIGGLYLVGEFTNLRQWFERSTMAKPFKPKYRYAARKYIMTQAESDFFRRLEGIAGDRYYIFPQVHLSSLLNHTAYKQSWRAALAAIQRKSVDYVLVDKETLETRYAVELDDKTHDKADRQERDRKVGQYLESVNIPLVRFRDVQSMTDDQLSAEFERASSEL